MPPYWIVGYWIPQPYVCQAGFLAFILEWRTSCNGGRCNGVGRTNILSAILDDSSSWAMQWTRVWVGKAAIPLGNLWDSPTLCLPYWIFTLHLGSPRLCCNTGRYNPVDMACLPSWITHPVGRCNWGSAILSGVILWYITTVAERV